MSNWNKKTKNTLEFTRFTLVSMICIYVIIAFASALTGNKIPPVQGWAGWVTVIGGIASGSISYIAATHRRSIR